VTALFTNLLTSSQRSMEEVSAFLSPHSTRALCELYMGVIRRKREPVRDMALRWCDRELEKRDTGAFLAWKLTDEANPWPFFCEVAT